MRLGGRLPTAAGRPTCGRPRGGRPIGRSADRPVGRPAGRPVGRPAALPIPPYASIYLLLTVLAMFGYTPIYSLGEVGWGGAG